jgi:hypothetical protein
LGKEAHVATAASAVSEREAEQQKTFVKSRVQVTEENTMDIPNFHDGFRIKPDKAVHVFLRTSDQAVYTLILSGVRAMKISGVMKGNIILDIVARAAEEMSPADMEERYGLAKNVAQASALLASAREQHLQLLELNPSYGAEGLILFEKWEIAPNAS